MSQNPRAGASPRVEIYRVKPPSKGLGARQTFDINGLYNFAGGKARDTIKCFRQKGKSGFCPPGEMCRPNRGRCGWRVRAGKAPKVKIFRRELQFSRAPLAAACLSPEFRMYPKARLDALTDGIFAVAMTILVLDLRLPEDFPPADDGVMAHALLGLWPKFLPYALSFYVLGSIWLAAIKLRSCAEFFDKQYVSWWLVQLLLATCVPFSSSVIGRFVNHAPSVWLYSANLAALGAVGLRMVT